MKKQHSQGFLALVTDSKKRVKEITPKILKEKIHRQEPMYVIDVREVHEWESGFIPTAIHLSKGIIERDIEKKISDLNTQIIVYCSGGFRSALVADNLQKMGYLAVYSLETGLQGWLDEGYLLEK
ncbi:rhodanese-like domain-containing protein [Fluoribacter dumoffii]|uniref:Thiosulfate sulfurtransferase glpE n=1 Tax=Fluoribacter dumoffii TaxID=463 RepID=A0A377G9V0_9GAMM|nr:rhodanese-like domain-containing protein [Fluoribacter dumoffii]KTC90279.1 rhodanese domain protein [Fluoribacter dumoffii NY 23]MCW8385597.1 rhodanese-like domain-containing protein [Fluoribacter dumoffii]MCW8418624.1 rhodanese-like domain-containing protein [Fluoribacter dumoffii]MCW8453532.1 rhodanese-like domain-containing protein [Fluoribacter dumoffii]MCW8459249.1 rhodanese-like domain-containing protein [Fluoribacter dumoffii]